jgi:hypothetical protein
MNASLLKKSSSGTDGLRRWELGKHAALVCLSYVDPHKFPFPRIYWKVFPKNIWATTEEIWFTATTISRQVAVEILQQEGIL